MPPGVDCGALPAVENGRVYQVNQSTVYDSVVEYHCFPKYLRQGPFTRRCMADGSWSGPDTKCLREYCVYLSLVYPSMYLCEYPSAPPRWWLCGGKPDGVLETIVVH